MRFNVPSLVPTSRIAFEKEVRFLFSGAKIRKVKKKESSFRTPLMISRFDNEN